VKLFGYDNPRAPSLYGFLEDSVEPKDYAVAFWIQRRLGSETKVFDYGGHVGIKYYALRKVLPFPEDLRWIVHDVPTVTEAGRKLAAERGERALSFTDSFDAASGIDVFLALGSLQYVETPLYERLGGLASPPPFVVVSSTPMTDGPRYVTLENFRDFYCPYLIEDRAAMLRGMDAIGYDLVHEWKIAEKSCRIIGRPDRSVHGYTSMHFAHRDHAPAR
jgi:putative methyltransferase (TIGR04325 family)